MVDVTLPELIALPSRVEGERVVVRPYARGDGEAVFAAVASSRERLSRWLPWPRLHVDARFSEAYARRCAARWMAREDLAVALLDRDGRFLGGSGLHRLDWKVRSAEIGYWIRDEAVGGGYVREAAALLTAVAFECLGARRVCIRCDGDNTRSAAVPRALGFAHEATLRLDRVGIDGETPADSLEFGLVRADLAALSWYAAARDRVHSAPLDG
jgi:ribosomal-protein-serine acetyltransferase